MNIQTIKVTFSIPLELFFQRLVIRHITDKFPFLAHHVHIGNRKSEYSFLVYGYVGNALICRNDFYFLATHHLLKRQIFFDKGLDFIICMRLRSLIFVHFLSRFFQRMSHILADLHILIIHQRCITLYLLHTIPRLQSLAHEVESHLRILGKIQEWRRCAIMLEKSQIKPVVLHYPHRLEVIRPFTGRIFCICQQFNGHFLPQTFLVQIQVEQFALQRSV